MKKLEKGVECPKFELIDQNGNKINNETFKGKKMLIYFYPKAMTSGCTTQSCNIRDVLSELKEQNIVSIGISPDTPERQKKFDDKHSLGFTLLADEDHSVANAFGVWGEKSMYGKKYMGIIRSSFLIDESGKIIESWYKVSPKNTVPYLMKSLEN